MRKLTFGSLFAGIGGLDLGFERAGLECRWQVEIDPYATSVLAKHWPQVPRWNDIRTFPPAEGDWSVDVICGGFPCQPHSVAGKRKGSEDERDLWAEFARVISVVRPRYVLAENVSGLLSTHAGRFFGRVLGEMAALGFDAEWHCIPASAVGAPHQRDRIFILAHSTRFGRGAGLRQDDGQGQSQASGGIELAHDGGDASASGDLADESGRGLTGLRRPRWQAELADCGGEGVADSSLVRQPSSGDKIGGRKETGCGETDQPRNGGQISKGQPGFAGFCGPAEPDLGGIADGLSGWLDSSRLNAWGPDWEQDVPRVGHKIPKRVDRLKCLGNAVVPQVGQLMAMAILEMEGAINETGCLSDCVGDSIGDHRQQNGA